MSRRGIRLMAVIAALSLFAAVPAAAQAKKIITISGSTSVFPLETQLARAWIKTKKGKKYGFRILQGGSNVGISDVAKGRVSIGASSRDPQMPTRADWCSPRSRETRSASSRITQTRWRTSPRHDQNIFVGPTCTNWSQVPGLRSAATSTRSGVPRPREPMTHSGTSSWAAPTRDVRRREGVERPRPAGRPE